MSVRCRLCRCDRPDRAVDGDGVPYCQACEELLPAPEQEMLGWLIQKVDALSRRLDQVAPAPDAGPADLVDADEAARRLAVTRDYVYAHADELGAIRLPRKDDPNKEPVKNPKPRLRFDPRQLAHRPDATNGSGQTAPAKARPTQRPGPTELLPIRGGRT